MPVEDDLPDSGKIPKLIILYFECLNSLLLILFLYSTWDRTNNECCSDICCVHFHQELLKLLFSNYSYRNNDRTKLKLTHTTMVFWNIHIDIFKWMERTKLVRLNHIRKMFPRFDIILKIATIEIRTLSHKMFDTKYTNAVKVLELIITKTTTIKNILQ